MNFVEYLSVPFADLSNTEETILAASNNVLLLNSIVVCNRGPQSIRFNLKKLRTQDVPVEVFLINELAIEPYKTVDVLKELGLKLFLDFKSAPSVSDSLICFSGGYTQKFDCEITYTKLNELPLPV